MPDLRYVRQSQGYSVFKCQKYSYFQKNGHKFPNTRAKVARQIAEAVEDFIDRVRHQAFRTRSHRSC